MTAPIELDTKDVDLTDGAWGTIEAWADGSASRAAYFKKLRDEAPVSFSPEAPIPGLPEGPGFWSVTRFEDIMTVSRHADIYCSGQGTNIPDLPIDIAEFYGSMINMDAPRHTRLRRIVSGSFTPRMVARIDDDVRVKARGVIAAVAEKGECDFVEEIAAVLPLQIICEMMGIPASRGTASWSSRTSSSGAAIPSSRPTSPRCSRRRSRWPHSPRPSARTGSPTPGTTSCRR